MPQVLLSEIFSDDEFNCRGAINIMDVSLQELAQGIKANGLLQPIVLQKYEEDGFKYRIICGHRRYAAFRILGEESIPAEIIENVDPEKARMMNFTENVHREDLTFMQEANFLKPYFEKGMSDKDIAQMVKASPNWVAVRRKSLGLEPEIQRRVEEGVLTQQQITYIAALPTMEKRMEATKAAVDHKLKGEKKALNLKDKNKEKRSFTSKKQRTKEEIFAVQELFADVFGNGIETRILAYCAGEISERDLHRDMELMAEERGINWTKPSVVGHH